MSFVWGDKLPVEVGLCRQHSSAREDAVRFSNVRCVAVDNNGVRCAPRRCQPARLPISGRSKGRSKGTANGAKGRATARDPPFHAFREKNGIFFPTSPDKPSCSEMTARQEAAAVCARVPLLSSN